MSYMFLPKYMIRIRLFNRIKYFLLRFIERSKSMNKISLNIQAVDKTFSEGKINYNKVNVSNVTGLDKPTAQKNKAYDVDISESGKLRSENSRKKAGVTSAREAFEESATEIKDSKRQKVASGDIAEIWKNDEPETYAKWVDAQKKLYETRTHEENGLTKFEPIKSFDDLSDEGKYYQVLASSIKNDYLSRRIYNANSPAKSEVDSIQKR